MWKSRGRFAFFVWPISGPFRRKSSVTILDRRAHTFQEGGRRLAGAAGTDGPANHAPGRGQAGDLLALTMLVSPGILALGV